MHMQHDLQRCVKSEHRVYCAKTCKYLVFFYSFMLCLPFFTWYKIMRGCAALLDNNMSSKLFYAFQDVPEITNANVAWFAEWRKIWSRSNRARTRCSADDQCICSMMCKVAQHLSSVLIVPKTCEFRTTSRRKSFNICLLIRDIYSIFTRDRGFCTGTRSL